jgi:hypothetical protein
MEEKVGTMICNWPGAVPTGTIIPRAAEQNVAAPRLPAAASAQAGQSAADIGLSRKSQLNSYDFTKRFVTLSSVCGGRRCLPARAARREEAGHAVHN